MAQQPRLATESVAGQRPYQEDSVLSQLLPDGRTLVAVADGMGGHAAGEVASALALETIREALQDGRSLDAAFRLANERVRARAREPGKNGMGTTLVAMLLDGDGYLLANVGDSRAYQISGAGIRQLTRDHSFVAEAIERGQSQEDALSSRWKDALTRSIGTDSQVEVDVFGPFPVESDTAVMLCSDGLYKVLDEAGIRDVFAGSGGPRGAAQALVAAALERGSDDNISVAIAEFGEVPRKRPEGTMEFQWEPPSAAPDAAAPEPEAVPAGAALSVADRRPRTAVIATAVTAVLVLLLALLILLR